MSDALSEAQTLYREALAASRDQRQQIEEDLAFSDPANPDQWDADEKRRRETDPGGARPCLVFDQLGQYVANVAGQVESAPPSLHALPVDGGADKKVAEQLDGHFRHIEHASKAYNHYQRAYTSAARCGVGYMVVRPEICDSALGYQEPRISSEGDPLRVVFDPWSVALDGSDANFGYILTPFSEREFKRRWPKADLVSFGEDDRRTRRDERESILIAESWTLEDETQNSVIFLNQRQDEVALPEDEFWTAHQRGEVLQVIGQKRETVRRVWWRRMNGSEVLETSKGLDGKESPYPADSIGIVPMYGYVGFKDGRLTYCGIPRRAMPAQRNYNYHMSEIRAYIATAPKAPWIASVRAIAGLEKLWDRASVEQRAYLPYNDLDTEGTISAPMRPQIAVNLQNHIQGAEQSKMDIQAALGLYQANLGAPSNETSGVAIEQRKQQGEASTAHFQSHGAAAIAQVGNLCMQMVCNLVDTKRRMRILGIDGSSSAVTLNPGQPEAVQESPDGLSINPNIGKYDVRVVVGAAYSTQRAQAQQALTEMMRANPALTPAIAPLWARVVDVPDADKLAEVLIAMAPPTVQAILKPNTGDQPTTAQLQAQLQQVQQALQEAIQHAKDAQAEADHAHQELAKRDSEEEGREAELQIQAYNAETARLKVTGANEEQIQAIVQRMLAEMAQTALPQPETHEMQPFPAAMDSPNAEMAPEMSNDDAGSGF